MAQPITKHAMPNSVININTKSTQFIISQNKKGMIRNVFDKKRKTIKLLWAMQVKI